MKIPMKYRAMLGVAVLAGAVYGCKDFLVTPPQGALDELTLANAGGVEATLIGAYRMLGGWYGAVGGWGASPSNWPTGSITTDDAYKGSEPSDQPDANDLELYNWGSGGAHAYLNHKWKGVYEGINRTNNTLRLLQQVQTDRPGEISEAVGRSIRGEALFLRAHNHFEAWRFWGNIPYYTEEDTDPRKPNTGTDAVPLILRDLDEAISLLSPTARNGQQGRVTQWTARAYKGRVQVYAGDYAGGLTTLREVVSGGPYGLEPTFNRVWTGFVEFANGPETVLAYQASVNDGDPNGDNSNWGERLNFPHSGSPFGCCGFHQPSQNLVNFFRVDANGLPLALNVGDLTPLSASASWNANNANFVAGSDAPVDPRLDWTIGRDGVPYKDWPSHPDFEGIHRPDWIREPSYGGPYSPKKHVHEFASGAQSNVGWNAQHLNSVNIHLFRYADLLLLLAEAEVEAGSIENARQIVNQIRARAGATAQGPGTSLANMAVPINHPSITWATYRIGQYPTFPNQAFARSAVRYERRLELAMEGQRLFDLRRWNEAPDVLNEFVAVERNRRPHLAGAAPVTERHSLFPIPTEQIDRSRVAGEDRLQQNPGW